MEKIELEAAVEEVKENLEILRFSIDDLQGVAGQKIISPIGWNMIERTNEIFKQVGESFKEFGFMEMWSVVYEVVALMNHLNRGEIKFTPEVLSILLESSSFLRDLLEARAVGRKIIKEEERIGAFQERIKLATIDAEFKFSPAEKNVIAYFELATTAHLNGYQNRRLIDSLEADFRIFKIMMNPGFVPLHDLETVMNFIGEVIAVSPSGIRVIVGTKKSAQFLNELLEKPIEEHALKIAEFIRR